MSRTVRASQASLFVPHVCQDPRSCWQTERGRVQLLFARRHREWTRRSLDGHFIRFDLTAIWIWIARLSAWVSSFACSDFTAQRCDCAVYAIALWPSVRVSVCHKSALYENGWTDRAMAKMLFSAYPSCFLRSFGYLQKLGYFVLELFPKLGT